jgi:UDP-N-acetylglucosamine transferase subunit ALG13
VKSLRVVAIVGTKGSFSRLVDALASWARTRPDADVWVQFGVGHLPQPLSGAPMVPHAELVERMRAADVVVCHGGGGAIRDALKLGHRPIVVPRLARHGEHVNDHQLELVEALGDRIVACTDPENLASFARAIETAGPRSSGPIDLPGDALRSDLRAALAEVRPAARAPLVWAVLDRLTRPIRPFLRR